MRIFGDRERVLVDGEPGTVIDSPLRHVHLVELDGGDVVERLGSTLKPAREDARPTKSSIKLFPVGSGERQDHETVYFGGQFIPVLGTVGGSKEESEQTAKNIEAFLKGRKG